MNASRNLNWSDLQQLAEYANDALEAIEQAIAVGKDVMPLIQQTRERLQAMSAQGRGPSDQEWDAQNSMIEDLNDKLNSDDR